MISYGGELNLNLSAYASPVPAITCPPLIRYQTCPHISCLCAGTLAEGMDGCPTGTAHEPGPEGANKSRWPPGPLSRGAQGPQHKARPQSADGALVMQAVVQSYCDYPSSLLNWCRFRVHATRNCSKCAYHVVLSAACCSRTLYHLHSVLCAFECEDPHPQVSEDYVS